MIPPYDAVLLVAFGGPEGPDDVLPFLENVVRGRNVPRERLLEVAEHYQHFGGVSPLNSQMRNLAERLAAELADRGPNLPIYWGNRNWSPYLADTMARMAADGIRRALAFVTSAYSSYSSCRQYLEDIERARQSAGDAAPTVDKIRAFYNHPAFIAAIADQVRSAHLALPATHREQPKIIFTAHSIPKSMADNCRYVEQLEESSRLVAEQLGNSDWDLVYQSRSGPPSQPWLEPDILEYLRREQSALRDRGTLIVPIGFLSDHIEVLYDLDTEARHLCGELGIPMVRAATPGTHPMFASMVRDLISERVEGSERLAIGRFGPSHDVCPADCCASGRPAAPAARQ